MSFLFRRQRDLVESLLPKPRADTPRDPFGTEERFIERLRWKAAAADQIISLVTSASSEPCGFTPAGLELAQLRELLTAALVQPAGTGLPPGLAEAQHGEYLLTDPFVDRIRVSVESLPRRDRVPALPADERFVVDREWVWLLSSDGAYAPAGELYRFCAAVAARERMF